MCIINSCRTRDFKLELSKCINFTEFIAPSTSSHYRISEYTLPRYLISALLPWSLYSLIWDFLLSQINVWTTTTWSNVWVVLPKPSWYEFLIEFLTWTPAPKCLHLTTFSNICVILIHVLIFVTVSKCQKSPKSTNIVILHLIWFERVSLPVIQVSMPLIVGLN